MSQPTTNNTNTASVESNTSTSINLMLNESVCLRGRRVLLVPYLKHHVLRYHDWLSREDILEATCSEQQSLEEEYENQVDWMQSDDKMTFIICAPLSVAVPEEDERKALIETASKGLDVLGTPLLSLSSSSSTKEGEEAVTTNVASSSSASVSPLPYDPYVMIGDCNLFKMPFHHTAEGEVEVSVMLAENRFRGKGIARETVALLMSYAYDTLKRSSFIAKILASNSDSKNLFEKGSLGFHFYKEVKAFDEIHYMKRLSPQYDAEEFGKLLDEEKVKESEEKEKETTAASPSPPSPPSSAASVIKTIADLKASVGYRCFRDYTPEAVEKGRVMALSNETEKAFYQ